MMTKKELLKPRYKVIADWPGSPFQTGEIIIPDEETTEIVGYDAFYVNEESYNCDGWPEVIKKLEWWEERDDKDLPEYVKNADGVHKLCGIPKWNDDLVLWQVNIIGDPFDAEWTYVFDKYMQPATKQEYEEWSTK